jgi:hypothetical protein
MAEIVSQGVNGIVTGLDRLSGRMAGRVRRPVQAARRDESRSGPGPCMIRASRRRAWGRRSPLAPGEIRDAEIDLENDRRGGHDVHRDRAGCGTCLDHCKQR